ncbi:MAG: ribonuclease Z [Methanomicrobiales archaeon]|nr:ribonuclease Z [Methanomicrobiales archaeon]MDI6876521.1 ribonuclease Z [Methanomicrobiales archaeon]
MVRIAGETLHVYFLGTAGALPTPYKNPPCIMVRRGSVTLLFDCGEGAQQQMMRARSGFSVDGIFVTHWHADHFLGIFGLTETLSFMGRTEPLTVYGPEGVHEFAGLVRQIGRSKLGFPLLAQELTPGSTVPFEGFSVTAFGIQHGMPGLGYILAEDDRPGRFNRERAIELGVPPGPLFGRLQRGETVTIVQDGREREIHPDDVLGPPRPGRKLIYTGDTRPIHHSIETVGRGADLLIHDATFDDAERERAIEVFHSTAGEAGEAAAHLNVQRLALVHISSRYTNPATHIRDARKKFDGEVIAPPDLTVLEISFRS